MALNAELRFKLDAGTLVNAFVGQLTGSAGALTAIRSPATGAQMAQASSTGGSFVPAALLDAVSSFSAQLPVIPGPAIVQNIEGALVAVEQFTSRDIPADLQKLTADITALLESADQDGIPGILLKALDLLKNSPAASALSGIMGTLSASIDGLGASPVVTDYLPAFASVVKVLAGLMLYDSILAEGERLTRMVPPQFQASLARQLAANLEASFSVGGQPLVQVLADAGPASEASLDRAARAVEECANQLDALADYVSAGMGFGEATLTYFDPARAQSEIATAGLLLRHPDLSALERVSQELARVAEPLTQAMDPGQASALGMDALITLAEGQVAQAAAAIQGIDAGVLVTPLAGGLSALTAPLRDFTSVVAGAVAEIQAVLEQVRSAVAALPIAGLATIIRAALAPVTAALTMLTQFVDTIRRALENVAKTVLAGLLQLEGVVDAFQQQILDLFQQARDFIDGLHLEQVVAAISDQVNAFVTLLQQAQMKPYFDTASSAIGAAADVISAVPLGLLPESMKGDLDTALKPIRDVDAHRVETEIETLLQISSDGKFTLRGDLEESVAVIQAKFEEVLTTLEVHHPRKYVQQLDEKLSALVLRIQEITPQVALEPVSEAIAQMKSALGSFDLEKVLEPVQSVFDQMIAKLDEFSPVELLKPLAERVTAARQKIEAVIGIDTWAPALDDLARTAVGKLDALDGDALDATLRRLLEELRDEADRLPSLGFGSWLGVIVTGMMRGANLRISPSSIDAALRWLGDPGHGSAELLQRAARISAALQAAKADVQAFDPISLTAILTGTASVRTAAGGLAGRLPGDSTARLRLEAGSVRLDAAGVLARLSANRTRYLALLDTSVAMGAALQRTGMSEVDLAVEALRHALKPLRPPLAKVRMFARYLGINSDNAGFRSIVQEVFRVASPARIAGLVKPLVAALRARLQLLIDEVLTPVRSAIGDLCVLLALIDLQPVIVSIESIFDEVRTQLLSFSPAVLLREQLDAFAALKQELIDFDPLAPLLTLFNGLRDAVARILGKLSAEKLLESPLAIYDTILNAIGQLNVSTLLEPVLNVLDEIALQVDQGLDETVAAFERLQQSLPPPGGGSSASASVSVG